MKNDVGYIYILINPSLEGLIKVGKTTRDPIDRAVELSKATGVPTPFIVAYQMLVNNCSKAEEFVHTWLSAKGYRVNDNREFFNAPMTEVINAILEYKKNDSAAVTNQDESLECENDECKGKPIWEDFLIEASMYEYGLGGQLQDYYKAYEL